LSLVFSLVASASLYWWQAFSPITQGAVAFALTMAAALLWRRRGIDMLTNILRNGNTTWSDDSPSAWARLQENRKYPVSQISVLLIDGTWINCDETAIFNDVPWSPCVLGSSGDVLMYATSIKPKDGPDRPQTTTLHSIGSRITYIPANQIARILLRHHHGGASPRSTAASPAET